ncbi:DNA polymerase III subunit beta [Azorhizobium doebereinerae]|uniref:DNA polymerase III subunit beta n=1 Tax=Azorhizobium doebereinerae TaxID=281091 RepID=UPI0003FC646A|nr:DNA polymerase III subunit beta [Azorhizobium doebereinerae]
MKLTIARDELLFGLDRIVRIVERRNTIPILANVRLAALGDALELSATDLDLQATTRLPASVGSTGETTLPAVTFTDFVKKLPAGADVTIETGKTESQMVIKSGRSKATLLTQPSSDFPDLNVADCPWEVEIPATVLSQMFEKLAFAISTEEARYYLNGIYFHGLQLGEKRILRGVATDGHRLSQHDLVDIAAPAGMPGIIIPRKTVAEISRLTKGRGKELIKLQISATKLKVTTGTTVLASKLIDGTFPDYTRVVPQGNNLVAIIDRVDFAAAVDRVATMSSERSRAVKFSFKPGRVEISVTSPDMGSAIEEMDVDYDGDSIDIGFNANYALDILGATESDNIRVAMADAGSPTTFQASTDGAPSLFVLMPMRV